jgi:hypothetical protein
MVRVHCACAESKPAPVGNFLVFLYSQQIHTIIATAAKNSFVAVVLFRPF